MLMGDAYIPRLQGHVKTHRLGIGHCIKQKDYLLYKAKALEWLTGVKTYEIDSTDSHGTKHRSIVLNTRTHPVYSKLYERFYHDYRKTIDEYLMKLLTPMGLAFLYQDDGSLRMHTNAQAVFIYCYCSGTKVELECISRWLAKRFGFEFRVSVARKSKAGQPYWCLRLRMKDRERFFELVKPWVVPCMEYKIKPTDDWVQCKCHDKIGGTCQNCGNSFERNWHRRNRPNLFCSSDCYHAFRRNGESSQAPLVSAS